MRKRKYGILSLDISTTRTGWSFSVKDRVGGFGTIKISKKINKIEKLVYFRKELIRVLRRYKPSYVVVENGFFGKNVSTLKALSEYAGVAKECCASITGVTPYVMNNQTTKSHFGVRTKEDLFDVIIRVYGWGYKGLEYKSHNDITDAVAQSVCYFETILGGHGGLKKDKQKRCIYEYDDGIFFDEEGNEINE